MCPSFIPLIARTSSDAFLRAHQRVVPSSSLPRREALTSMVRKMRREAPQLNRCRAAFAQSTWLFCLSFFLGLCRSR